MSNNYIYSLKPRPMDESTMGKLEGIFNLKVADFMDFDETTKLGVSGMAFHFNKPLSESQISEVAELGYEIEVI